MFSKKMKIEVNDNFNMIKNFIYSSTEPIKFSELVDYCCDYDLYKELYININIFKLLIDEKNEEIKALLEG